jgi:hypothetical protein
MEVARKLKSCIEGNPSGFCYISRKSKTRSTQFGSEGDLRDWFCKIQEACARESNNLLKLAGLMAEARHALPRGGWSQLWQTKKMPFSKRKGEMLVVIGKGVEGLNANNCAHLPIAWRTLYFITRLGRQIMERLIDEGRIHPGLSLQGAKELLTEYLPKSQRTPSRSKMEVRLARFSAFIRTNLETWSQEERATVCRQLLALDREIRSVTDEATRISNWTSLTQNLSETNKIAHIYVESLSANGIQSNAIG